ncbi:glutamate-rich protein 3 isoform X2 [Crotalus tigris]|uniref:glutamate-rich protein 3 isoform X2 n=1 Tax=Crotalus tigris TaxID=88082 RepID=UPI00192F64D5|nr:glutamate-rich protein 3 isoform X2 [Crotalus tigris]
MNHPHFGYLANYNSLTDKHLTGYFSNTRIRRHLRRSGLISRSGRIISDKEYRLNAMKKDHQKYIRECLAQAIFHKALDMERHHQGDIKRKLESSARRERIQRTKADRTRKAADGSHHLLSPHPPTVPRNRFGRRKLGERGPSSHTITYPRPSTAPGNIQQPLRLQPLYGNVVTEGSSKTGLSCRPKFLTVDKEYHFASEGDKGILRPVHSMDYSVEVSPYRLPIINNYMIPIPQPPRSDKTIIPMKPVGRGRRFRPTTSSNGLEQLLMKDTGKFCRPQIQSNAYVTMVYLGKTVHLSYDLLDYREEIKIYQQHCGGENLCVYRGKLLEGETFQFISRRHHGFPFSLTFYLNGIQVDRLSSCCEYKHRKGTRLGGKHGYFGFINVERSSPCYRCIISLGLDKKPTPPKKKTLEESAKLEDWKKEDVTHKLKEEKKVLPPHFPSASAVKKRAAERAEEKQLETKKREEERDEFEDTQKTSAYEAYEEDFEADEKKSVGKVEKVEKEARADDQMSEKGKPLSEGETDRSDDERKKKISSQKSSRTSDSERDESEGYTESYTEEEERKHGKGKATDLEMDASARKIQAFYRKHKGRKQVLSVSGSSTLYSSATESESEGRKRDEEEDVTDIHSEYETETTKSQREGRQGTDVEEEENLGETESLSTKNVPDIFYEEKVEMTLQDMSPGHEKPKLIGSVDMGEEEEKDKLVHLKSSALEGYPSRRISEDKEGDRKSVREKIAEAIEKDQLLSSEPEPSDYSTEDEDEHITAAQDKHEAPDEVSLAKPSRRTESQRATKQMKREREMMDKEGILEEEELVAGKGPKEAALTEELLAPKRASLRGDQGVKPEFLAGKREWEREPIESDLASIEKEITPKDEKIESVTKTGEMAIKHKAADGEEVLGGFRSEGEETEDAKISEKSRAAKREEHVRWQILEGEEGAEVTEAPKALKTRELEKIKTEDRLEAKEKMKGKYETAEDWETTSAEKISIGKGPEKVGEAESKEIFQEKKHKAEAGKKADIMEKKRKDEAFLREDEERKYELRPISPLEAGLRPSQLKVEDVLYGDEKAAAAEKAITSGREVPSEMEETIQGISSRWDEDLYQEYPDVTGMKAISTEDLSLKKIEPLVGEAFLDHEIEITEEDKLAGKPYSEREKERQARAKDILAIDQTAQGEKTVVQPVERGAEERLKFKMAAPEEKLDLEKEGLYIEPGLESMAVLMEELAKKEKAKGEMWVEEAEGQVKGLSPRQKMIEQQKTPGRKAESEERGAEMALKEEAETDETEVKTKRKVEKEEIGKKMEYPWEAEGDMALKREVETGEAKVDVGLEEELEVTEAEADMTLKGEAERGHVKAKVEPKGDLHTEKAEAEMTFEREEEIGRIKAKVEPKLELYAEEAEAEMTLESEAEIARDKAKVVPKGDLYAEEAEAEMTLEREAEIARVKAKVVPKGDLYAEEAEAEVTLEREAEIGYVKAKMGPKGDLYAEEAEAEMTLEREAEIGRVKAKVAPKGDLYAEEAEAEMTPERQAEIRRVKAKMEPKGDLYAEEAEAEVTLERGAELGRVKAKVGPEGELYPKEAEAKMILEREAEIGRVKAKMEPKGDLYAEEAEAEVTLEREAEIGRVKAKMEPKGDLYAEEAEAEMTLEREAEIGRVKAKMEPKGDLYAEEAKAEMTPERQAEPGRVKAKVGPEGELYAEEAEAEVTFEREAETAYVKAKMVPKEDLYAEEVEAEMTLEREAEPGHIKVKMGPEGELYLEEPEAEMIFEREAEPGRVKPRMVPEGELYAEKAEAEVSFEREAETGHVKAKVVPKGDLYAEEAETEVTFKREAETGQVKAKIVPKEDLYAEEAEAEVSFEREAETGLIKARLVPKGELYPGEAEAEVTIGWKAETGQVKARVAPKGELDAEKREAELTVAWKAETRQVKAKVTPKEELYAEEAEAEMILKREVEPGLVKAKMVPERWLDAEEAEAEVRLKGKAEIIEAEFDKIPERKLEVEGSEAEGKRAESHVALKWKPETGEAEADVVSKGELEVEEAEAELTFKGKAIEKALKQKAVIIEEEADVIPKEELEVKEAEPEWTLKRKAEPGQAKVKVVPKGELGAEEAEAEMTLKRKGETIETESEVIAGKDLEAEDAEVERTLKKKAEGKVALEQKAKIVTPETEVAFEEKAEVKVVPKLRGEEETEDSEANGEVLSVVIGSLNETTFGEQGLVTRREEIIAEIKHTSESAPQKEAFVGGEMKKEPSVQTGVSDKTGTRETFLYMEVQEEVIAPEEEKEQDESDTCDEMREGMITLADVEEALLIGIQQLITEVSQINENDKDKEEPSVERSAEDESTQECATSEDFFAVVVDEEREIIESSNSEEEGTGEHSEGTGEPSEEGTGEPSEEETGEPSEEGIGEPSEEGIGEPSEETPSDEKDGNMNCEIGLEETTDETITMTNTILWSSQEYERECHQVLTGTD